MLITLTPILNSTKGKPVIGTAIAGRMLHQDGIAQIWEDTLSTVEMSRLTTPCLQTAEASASGPALSGAGRCASILY